jgi:RNA polymerase sigma factor (TIGR02999 family)
MNGSDSEPTPAPVHSVTELLLAWRRGNQAAYEQLVPLVYEELRRMAHQQLRRERRTHTLQTAELVNETYLRLVDANRVAWQNRAHFLAVAARSMRQILVDRARSRGARKRGGNQTQVALDPELTIAEAPDINLVALDDALTALAAADLRRSQVVELRFFGGLTVDEAAEVLGVSPETVMRDWKVAKAWLYRQLNPGNVPGVVP